jgi:ribosomal protein L11 methyltransferase
LDYLELTLKNVPEEQKEILICLLSEEGFESFKEEGEVLAAYIKVPLFDAQIIGPLLTRFDVHATHTVIPEQNWNEVWEKQYDPVLIREQCFIRAPFHDPRPDLKYDILIEPKMSFGTAHHETTSLMIELMLEISFQDRKVLDMGCGTGILAILSAKAGAAFVVAIDNDEWSYRNSLENVEKNNLSNIHVVLGDVKNIHEYQADVLLANINRNILLDQIPYYAEILQEGDLLLSGFYEADLPAIREIAEEYGFREERFISRNQWVAAKFSK